MSNTNESTTGEAPVQWPTTVPGPAGGWTVHYVAGQPWNFCPQCGRKVDAGAVYCAQCGQRLHTYTLQIPQYPLFPNIVWPAPITFGWHEVHWGNSSVTTKGGAE